MPQTHSSAAKANPQPKFICVQEISDGDRAIPCGANVTHRECTRVHLTRPTAFSRKDKPSRHFFRGRL